MTILPVRSDEPTENKNHLYKTCQISREHLQFFSASVEGKMARGVERVKIMFHCALLKL